MTAPTDHAELVERLKAEISSEHREEILSKGWDYALRKAREGGHGDHPRQVFESWMLDGKDELLADAAAFIRSQASETASLRATIAALEAERDALTQTVWDHIGTLIENTRQDGISATGKYSADVHNGQQNFVSGIRFARASAVSVIRARSTGEAV